MTVAAFAVQDWGIIEHKAKECFDCGMMLTDKKPRVCPITGEFLCKYCYKYRTDEIEHQKLLDEMDLQRGMGVEPPRAAVEHIEDHILYGLDDDGQDYWD